MKHLPVLTGADRSACTNDDLKGFAATAWWKPLVPQEVAVPEPQNIVTTLHATTPLAMWTRLIRPYLIQSDL